MSKFKNLILVFTVFNLFSCLSGPDTDSKINQADKYRMIIKKYNLQKYYYDNYQKGEKNYNDAKKLLEAKKKSQADKLLIEANVNYKAVIDKGFPLYINEKENETIESRNNAKDIKADVAVKEEFDAAVLSYNEALKYNDQKDYENAVNLLDDSKLKFDQAYKDASFKKEKTEKSIDSTEKVKADIENQAAELEQKLIDSNKKNAGE